MSYERHRHRDSQYLTIALLFASASILATALVWRRTAAPRSERRVARRVPHGTATEGPHATAATGDRDDGTQHASSGAGSLIHRQYEVTLRGSWHDRTALFSLMTAHLTELAPSALADFEKSGSGAAGVAVGDEYDITMLGPWNGRVRVSELARDSLTLVTLEGHPEAGTITFSVHDTGTAGHFRVLIESWARARDTLVQAAYSTVGIGRQVQSEVWITFLQRFSALAGADDTPEVRISTEELANDDRTYQRGA